jgi:hypothetical protein
MTDGRGGKRIGAGRPFGSKNRLRRQSSGPHPGWGGKRIAGPGKKIGHPFGSSKLLKQAAALATIDTKSGAATPQTAHENE